MAFLVEVDNIVMEELVEEVDLLQGGLLLLLLLLLLLVVMIPERVTEILYT